MKKPMAGKADDDSKRAGRILFIHRSRYLRGWPLARYL